jgi:NADH dehydrogenase/NADH:ubiquinone oxidoreductase subunit G
MAGKTVSFTIDGATVEASEGQSVLEACDAAGIDIPT